MSSDTDVLQSTKASYRKYYAKHDVDRNDFLRNPGVLFQTFAFERANVEAFRSLDIDPVSARVLDVGCGTGASLLTLLRMGYQADGLRGVDINPDRIAAARALLPSVEIRCESADQLSFLSGEFDIVFESTMFLQLTDATLAKAIAAEMVRVTRVGGYLVLADWRFGKPFNPDYCAVTQRRLRHLFDVGGATRRHTVKRGALIPPVGRFLSRFIPSGYFLVQTFLPLLVGQTTTVLRRVN